MLTNANTFRTGASVLEAPGREAVIHLQDLGLAGRFLASQSEEADPVLVQIHLTANQTVGPHLAQRPGPPQQSHLTVAVAAPQVDQSATRPFLQVQLPSAGERLAVRRRLRPRCPVLTQGRDVALGTAPQARQV